jgi:hypothetical protein
MKKEPAMKLRIEITIASILPAFCFLPSAFGQGSLTPPGAPAPGMKTLQQIEPRTAISSAPFTISTAGSYYLTTNLTTTVSNAIVIAASGVTLDLNGFTIFSTTTDAANGGAAILLGSGLRDVTILNGHILSGVTNNSGVYSGSGFDEGVSYSGVQPTDVRVSGVTVSGCLINGINLGNGTSTLVESCVVQTAGSTGINASTVRSCEALDCSSGIFGDEVTDSQGQGSWGEGIGANYVAQNCYGSSGGIGIGVDARNVKNCYGYSSRNNSAGINAYTAESCYGYNNANGYGIAAVTAQNCFGNSSGSGPGIEATAAGNCVGYCGDGGVGISANTAQNCYGNGANSGYGVSAEMVQNCYGYSNGNGYGINASSAQNCSGYSQSNYGLYAGKTAIGCYGSSNTGTGLWAYYAANCIGSTSSTSPSQFGLYAYDVAIGSYGSSGFGGVGLRAFIANSSDGTSQNVTFKYNMP